MLVELKVAGVDAIASAQQTLLARLGGTRFTVTRRCTSVPMLALEIGPDALAVLEGASDLVKRVSADRALPPARRT